MCAWPDEHPDVVPSSPVAEIAHRKATRERRRESEDPLLARPFWLPNRREREVNLCVKDWFLLVVEPRGKERSSRSPVDALISALRARSSDPGACCSSTESHWRIRVDYPSHLSSLLARRSNPQIVRPRGMNES